MTDAAAYEQSAGCIIERSETAAAFAGSCFALWRSDLYVTAAHCTREDNRGRPLDAHELAVLRPTSGLARVTAVHRHESADLAVVRLDTEDEAVRPFERVGAWPIDAVGETVHHFGFTEDRGPGRRPGHILGTPLTARVNGFHGVAGDGYQYVCARVTAAPDEGQSGGPFFRPDAPLEAVGLYTARTSEHEPIASAAPFSIYRLSSRSGSALRLADYTDWLRAAAALNDPGEEGEVPRCRPPRGPV
jgi:hypothetical protein